MVKKLIEIFLFGSALVLCLLSYSYWNSVNVEGFSPQKAKNLFSKTSKVKMILDISDNKDKIIITDVESKVAMRDIQTIEDDVAALSISYEKISKLHEGRTKYIFYFSISSMLLAGFLILANKFERPKMSIKNSSKVAALIKDKSIFKKNSLEESENSIPIKENPLNIEEVSSESSIENFLSNHLISNEIETYKIVKVENNREDSISYIIESVNENSLILEYDRIEGFLSDLSYSCSNLIPNVELSRDVSSQKVNFTVDFDPIANTGESLNA